MSELFVPRVGAVLSADIAVPQHEREVLFYARVLSTGERPLWREEDLMNNLGLPVIGLGARTDSYADLPLQWMPHIQVADVDASVERAVRRGGILVMRSGDENGGVEWAVLLDPGGAAFGILSVAGLQAPSVDANSADAVGRIAWLDLTVPDAESTRDFYSAVVPWRAEGVPMRDGETSYADYNMFGEGNDPVAGICHARGMNAGLPSVWMIYLPVADLVESLRRVELEGGDIMHTVRNRDGDPMYVVVRDPVGAHFALARS